MDILSYNTTGKRNPMHMASTQKMRRWLLSHGGYIGAAPFPSWPPARFVADGLEASVVTMNQANDIDMLAERGLVAADWAKKLPPQRGAVLLDHGIPGPQGQPEADQEYSEAEHFDDGGEFDRIFQSKIVPRNAPAARAGALNFRAENIAFLKKFRDLRQVVKVSSTLEPGLVLCTIDTAES